ncbi:MAG: PQQ-binding-like beta-propeller repeat protein, partial [Planctomycetes bacterium]|nr:PQQ-binding-like beta-propeller repeat protein [Planctomycetota bacterium]
MTDANKIIEIKMNVARYRAAARTAAVAGAFCLIVGVLLLATQARARRFDPINSERIALLKKQLGAATDKERKDETRQQILTLDTDLRREYFRSMQLAQRGAYLLAGGVIVLVISLRCAASCRKTLPMPAPAGEDEAAEAKAQARRSVAAIGAAIACAGAIVVMTSRDLPGQYTVIDAQQAGLNAGEAPAPGTQEKAPTLPTPEEIEKNWSRFRGPAGRGVSAYTNVPASWNGASGEAIIWKSEVPLPGQNSPVVWDDRIFLTGAAADKREVYCFDAESGKMLWGKEVASTAEPPNVFEETGYAAPTTATDGRRVYAIFATGDVACFDFSGVEVWTVALGVPE